jgi:hypothetical protein
MVYHHYTIARRMHIQLYRISAQLEGLLECRDRVFGKAVVRATVGYALWDLKPGALGQAGLAVVTLGTMIAKL